MKIVFMGTPNFAKKSLEALLTAGHEICAVYSQPPRRAKRGLKEQKSAVHKYAEEQNLPVYTPVSFKDEDNFNILASWDADIAVVAAYGLLLPETVLRLFPRGCLNIHASLLPRWRGAAPIQRAIEAGDQETGISIMRMERGLDTGAVLLTHSIEIDFSDTAGGLHDKLSALGSEAIVEALNELDELVAWPQDEEGVTYANKIDKAESEIDWTEDPNLIARKIRAFSPFPGAWFQVSGERIKVLNARASEIGELNINGVEILKLQRAGKRAQLVHEFIKGYDVSNFTSAGITLKSIS